MAIEQRIEIRDRELKAALSRLLAALPAGANMTPVMKDVGRALKTGVQLRFREQRSPEGTPWIPSKRAQAEGGATLRLTGRLRNSITYDAHRDSVEIGTNVVYAAIHQFGGYAGRSTSAAGPIRRAFLVARPYLGASASDETEILRIVTGYIARAWEL